MFIGQLKSMTPEEEAEKKTNMPPEMLKSTNFDEFIKSAETKKFLNEVKENGLGTIAGGIALLRETFRTSETDHLARTKAKDILALLDKNSILKSFGGLKAAGEKIMKKIFGGGS